VLFDYYAYCVVDDYGRKKQHSIADCTFVMKRTVDLLHIVMVAMPCFIGFKQALGSVDYWLPEQWYCFVNYCIIVHQLLVPCLFPKTSFIGIRFYTDSIPSS